MNQNSKKVTRRPPPKTPVYVAPKPKKPTIWLKIAPELAMLRLRPLFYDPRGSPLARKVKNSATCVVAPVYVAVEQFPEWSTEIVCNIFAIGNEVHRLTLQQLKLRANSSYPIQCVCPTFLLNSNRVTVLVRACVDTKPISGGTRSSIDKSQAETLETLLSENHGVVIQCSGKTFSFWKDKNKYFAFIPEGFRDDDNRHPALLKAKNLRALLENTLKTQRGACSLYSVKVLNKFEIPMTLENINEEFKISEGVDNDDDADEQVVEEKKQEAPPPAPTPAPTTPKGKKGKKEAAPPPPVEEELPEDPIALNSDYKELPDKRGILVGKEYCKEPERIPHTIVAAALFLHHFPANLWTSIIIHDIIKFGKQLYTESEIDDLLDNEYWLDRIRFPISFMKKTLGGNFDKLVFGKITSADPDILSIEQGLLKFFDGNDTGIIVGPQMVLVWQQKNVFFMFDPKERDGMGRKWTRALSSAMGSTALNGSACVTWYRNPRKLAEVYTETIAIKHRNDPYKIVKVKFYEVSPKEEDDGEWIGMAENKWMIFGTKTLCDYSYAEDTLRKGKALCIGINALITAIDKPEDEWDSETIDKILKEGVEMLKVLLPTDESASSFTLRDVKPMFDLVGKRIRFSMMECRISGPMTAETTNPAKVQLKNGLVQFFETASYAMFTVKDIALALWRGQDKYFYIFYPYEKLIGMSANCICENDLLPPMGIANAMRFKTINDVFNFLSLYLNTKENDEYCLTPINISTSPSDQPPLYEYEEFGENAAILKPINNLHEGHEIFGVRADKQTLANLLTALAFNRINNSLYWTREDMVDILKIGDKMFCKIYMALPECKSRDYKLQWEDVAPMVGMNKFSFVRNPIVGVLEIQPEIMGEEMEGEMEEEIGNDEGIEIQDEDVMMRNRGVIMAGPASARANDLKGILHDWDAKKTDYSEAVLETDFYKIAIWKRENFYFVFDPKASGDNGELTERRLEVGKDAQAGDNMSLLGTPSTLPDPYSAEESEKRPERPLFLEKRIYTQFDNEGSAYTAWFTNFDDFFQHITKKTPEDHKYGQFTLHDLTLTNVPIVIDDFEWKLKPGFHTIAPNHSMLRGSITMKSPSLANRNKIDLTNCIVAIAFAKFTPSNKMTTTLLDVFLKYGDRLYTKSLNVLQKSNAAVNPDNLTLENILSTFSIYTIKFKLKLNNTYKGNLFMNELKKPLSKFASIENGTAFILRIKGYYMAFWKSNDGSFYVYDPFETNPRGVFVDHGGLPSMSQFAKLDHMLGYLLAKFICVDGPNSFLLYMIGMESDTVEKASPGRDSVEQTARTKLSAQIAGFSHMFQPYPPNMRILKSPLTANHIPQHGLALAALVHSQLQFVELWNTNISQRISVLARYIINKSDCEIELLQPPGAFDDIRSSFVIDNELLCHITFTKNIQGPICSTKRTEIVGVNLKNAITMFFKSCRQVVIYLPGTRNAYALWRENSVFYLFGLNSVEREMYIIASTALVNLLDIVMKGTNTDEDLNNWYELRSITISVVPLKDGICKPLKITNEVMDGPLGTFGKTYASIESKDAFFFDYVSERPEGLLVKRETTEFEKVPNARGTEILFSSDALKSHRFFGTKNFFPSLQAACVEASALARVKFPGLWTKKTLEKLLLAGINLYINTVAVKGTSSIQMTDFKGNIYLDNQKLEVNPLMTTVQSASKTELLKYLTWILRKYQSAYLYTDTLTLTLMLENSDYFLYYPHNKYTESTEKSCSCLIKFCTISDLLDRLLVYKEIVEGENVYMGPIFVFNCN